MLKKISSILLVAVMMVMLVTPLVASAQLNQADPTGGSGGFANQIFGCGSGTGVLCIIQRILLFILAIAFIIAVIFLVVGGFRYIVSQGNEEAVEKAKGTITNAIIGIVVIVLAWVILTVVFNLVNTGSAV